MSEINRLRWRARRGMLELDILLLDFIDHRYATLPASLQATFATLLELEDSVLWDMIQSGESVQSPAQTKIIEWLRKTAS
jgi:antitoxin CptB